MISKIVNKILRFWYWNRSTKIGIFYTDQINRDNGYFECNKEIYQAKKQFFHNCDIMPFEQSIKIFNDRMNKIEYKYFGPRIRRIK